MEEYLDSLNSFEEIFDQIELVPTKNMSKKQKTTLSDYQLRLFKGNGFSKK